MSKQWNDTVAKGFFFSLLSSLINPKVLFALPFWALGCCVPGVICSTLLCHSLTVIVIVAHHLYMKMGYIVLCNSINIAINCQSLRM